MKPKNELGKFLCYVLRHNPSAIPGLTIDDEGWVDFNSLVSGTITAEDINQAVLTDSKGRFEVRDSFHGKYIRCGYGHSIPHVKIVHSFNHIPPTVLYHGTSLKAYEHIKHDGLKAMGRNAVCLSTSLSMACETGLRHAKTVEQLVVLCIKNPSIINPLNKVAEDIWVADYVEANLLSMVPETEVRMELEL